MLSRGDVDAIGDAMRKALEPVLAILKDIRDGSQDEPEAALAPHKSANPLPGLVIEVGR